MLKHSENKSLPTPEKRNYISGLGSIFYIRCRDCLAVNTVPSGKQHVGETQSVFDVNSKLVLGTLHAGLGYSTVNKVLQTMNVPNMCSKTFKKYEREIGPAIEVVAKESCRQATELERSDNSNALPGGSAAPENPPTDPNTLTTFNDVVRLFVSYDMGYSKRGSGQQYDSLNGYSAIIGALSRRVLDYTRNRKCHACDLGLGKDVHDCRMNFHGSVKAMEASAAVELITQSKILTEKNVEVGVFIGDDDSSSIRAVRNATDRIIVKQSDRNHASKGVRNVLYKTANDKNVKGMSADAIKYLHRCYTYAVAQNQGNSTALAASLRNIPYHAYDQHDNCGKWCGYLNAVMARKAPKALCYSLSESADYRYASAVCQKNEGEKYVHSVLQKVELSPAKQPVFKAKRQLLKKERSQLRYSRELIAQDTYETHMGLLHDVATDDLSTQKIDVDPVESTLNLNSEDTLEAIVFFDLETSGLKTDCDVLQIAAICREAIFEKYIKPRKPCVLVAHNCAFDAPRLIRVIEALSLQEEFVEAIDSVVDTLPLFRKKFPKTDCSLRALAAKAFPINLRKVHNAVYDVQILQKVAYHHFPIKELLANNKSFSQIIEFPRILKSLEPLETCVSKSIRLRIAKQVWSPPSLRDRWMANIQSLQRCLQMVIVRYVGSFSRITGERRFTIKGLLISASNIGVGDGPTANNGENSPMTSMLASA
ncbi:hypothetical protein KPH14_001033 [Odynerus spinipes]|uniref:Mutator-like transposase domain-containing protein n=1 Tax=Odynerus spinipes TaxID=1348599 RepID=A0AAD9RFE1_9HYME|nr:hypothetical protein KPH14_001033 [Odynerus spinipes]